MDKSEFTKSFSNRLHDAMISAGHHSQRSTSGVCIHKLVEITGYSLQICRKYLKGEAIPEPPKLQEIATKLKVSAGWLLFGDEQEKTSPAHENIFISKSLLHYIFTRASILYKNSDLEHNAPNFLMDLIHDIGQINADAEQSKKIVDLAMSSLRHFTSSE